MARHPAQARPLEDEAGLDLVEVPAAVVCAVCGRPDCVGCATDETTHPSGIVAIVPWERPTGGWLGRLWSTSRLATVNGEAFFAALPEGDVAPALAFAVAAELAAASGLALIATVGFAAVSPAGLWLLLDPGFLSLAGTASAWGVPALAGVMVGLHVLHGLGLDVGARRHGSGRRGRGLRFGLYACGWDLVTTPLGVALTALTGGPAAAMRAVPLGLSIPARAARAYLRGIHRLDDAGAKRAARSAVALALAVALTLAVVAGAAMLASFTR
ncbi:MAG: hypothetical protein IT376_19920 [Polyangiaceae bacterium]|nr:hypothetical protein [Polyangiaceae bacterium]